MVDSRRVLTAPVSVLLKKIITLYVPVWPLSTDMEFLKNQRRQLKYRAFEKLSGMKYRSEWAARTACESLPPKRVRTYVRIRKMVAYLN